MFTSSRRRSAGARTLTTSLALAASVALAAAPLASAQSTTEADGAVAVSSLGSSIDAGSASGSLGSLAQPAYADYVALGDSYAALGDSREPTGTPAACGRNLGNYPHQLDANPAVGELTDATCGAARIPDLAGSQTLGTAPNTIAVPPQLDALDAGTDLVTLSIGGNDVGFGTIVGCITAPLSGGAAKDCRALLDADVTAGIERVFGEDGEIDEVYDAIETAAPNAKVVATQYLPLMPAEDEDGCQITDAFGAANLQWAREIAADINDAVDSAAQRNGRISVLPVDTTVDRSACAPVDQRWTDFLGQTPGSAQMHPTALGQRAMAEAIAAAL